MRPSAAAYLSLAPRPFLACFATVALISTPALPPASAAPEWSTSFQGSGPSGPVNTLAAVPHAPGSPGRLYVGGEFTSITRPTGPLALPYLAAWDGHAWSSGAAATSPPIGSLVQQLTIHPFNGVPTLWLAGSFGVAPGVPLARLTNGHWTGVSIGPQSWLSGIASYDLGAGPRLALSASFSQPSPYIVSLDGGTLSAMGGGVITVTRAFAVFDDGQGPRLYVGAGPENAGQVSLLGRFDGTTWSIPAGGVIQQVLALAVFDDGTGPALYVGGDFRWVGPGGSPVQASRIARFKNNVWSTLGTGVNGTVRALTAFDDGTGAGLYVGGDFTTAGDRPASRIARWRAGDWSPLGAGINDGSVRTLAAFDDDGSGALPPALYAGGTFTMAGGHASPRIARWGLTRCPADVDDGRGLGIPDGGIGVEDLLYYLSLFDAGLVNADVDDGTATGTLDGGVGIEDLLYYLARYNAGC